VPPEHTRPGLHPEPPEDLLQRPLPLLSTDHPWFRIYRLQRPPLYFGRSGGNRFDPPAREYGVLYVGEDERCAFIETFGHATDVRFVTVTALRTRGLARIEVRRPLRLVDLTGPGLARLGADERLCAGDYAVAQRWALALSQHPERPDGLCYRARHDPSRLCAAISHRAAKALKVVRLGSLADPANVPLLADLLDTYTFGLLDDTA